ncbi:UNVERIFIED_CONTAM: hypothetical protein Slati_1164600 [Sesamum latifolium]|uniref:Uncharacterized protein n=1 Tax=Sesamum latifolium TaxID=2727402 RepID=A0AAW2XDZ2_9LAMI
MKGILIQQKVFKAIDGKYSENISDEKCLENDENCGKLEELYTESSLPSKLFLLEKFFRYKLDVSKTIDDNIDDFTKLIQDIKLTGDKNIDDYSPIVLLNAITYGDVKSAIKYGRDSVNLETVISGLKSKEIDLRSSKPIQNQPEVNLVRGRTKNRNHEYKHRRHSNSKAEGEEATLSIIGIDMRKRMLDVTTVGVGDIFIKDCKKPRRNPPKDSANNSDDTVDEVYMLLM